MTLSQSSRIVIPEGVLVRKLQEESVLLNINTESYFGLDEVGTRMWTVLSEAESIAAGMERLLAEYDVDHEKLENDVDEFLTNLVDKKLIELK